MNCLFCKELSRALEVARSEYFDARLSVFFKISTELAANKQVEMERAKTCLVEHQLTCARQTVFQVIRIVPVNIASALQWKMIA